MTRTAGRQADILTEASMGCTAGFCLAFAALCWAAVLPFWVVLLLVPTIFLAGLQLMLKGAPLLRILHNSKRLPFS